MKEDTKTKQVVAGAGRPPSELVAFAKQLGVKSDGDTCWEGETTMKTDGHYRLRRIATDGCEILAPNGSVVAWTVDDLWAAIIVRLLNGTDYSGVAAVAGMENVPEATCCRCGYQQPLDSGRRTIVRDNRKECDEYK